VLRASFSERHLTGFVDDLISGKEALVNFRFELKIKKAKEWVDAGPDEDDFVVQDHKDDVKESAQK